MNGIKEIKLIMLLLGILVILIGCGSYDDEIAIEPTKENSFTSEPTYSPIPTPVPTPKLTIEPKLSKTCDKILASDIDKNGDSYQLVANETQDYSGVTIEIGVIKNNKWLLEPTTNMPFIDADGTLYGKAASVYDRNYKMFYLGNGCFLCESSGEHSRENLIYNANTKQYYEKMYTNKYDHICITYNCLTNLRGIEPCYDIIVKLSEENPYVITALINYEESAKVEVLNTNTMEVNEIIIKQPEGWMSVGCIYPISNGVFAVADNRSNHNRIKFYDINGHEIFESDFVLSTRSQNITYKADGTCTFEILNEADTPYLITIDKNGNVISYE